MPERVRARAAQWMPMSLATFVTLATLASLVGLGACGAAEEPSRLPARVLVVAVESLGWERLDHLLDRGELPHLARLIDEGVRGVVHAPDPLSGPTLWTTAFTGLSPRVHRVTGELAHLPNGSRILVPSLMRRNKTLMQIVGDEGRTIVSVGIPVTWPAESVNGFLVAPGATPSRWTLTEEHTTPRDPSTLATYPASLYEEIRPLLRDPGAIARENAARFFTLNEREYAMLYDEPLGSIYKKTNPLRDFAITYQRDLSYVDVTLELMERYSPKLATVHLELLDALLPVYWPFAYPDHYETPPDSRRRFGSTIDEGLRFVDQQIGRLVAALPAGSAVIVIGDRGFGNGTMEAEDGPRTVAIAKNQAAIILWGQGIARGQTLDRVALADLTPTVLALMGLPVGANMEGSVLLGALRPEFLAANPRRSVADHDEGWDQTDRFPPGVANSPLIRPTEQP